MVKGSEIFLLVLTAVLLVFSFPKVSLGWLSYFALVPLFVLVKAPRSSFIAGWLTGVLFYSGILWWLFFLQAEEASFPILSTGIVILIIYLSIYVGLFTLILSLSRRWVGLVASYLLSPFIWVSLEYLRGLTLLGFPWGTLAYTQSEYPTAIQLASLGGVELVSGWLVLINALCVLLMKLRTSGKKFFTVLVVLVLSMLLPHLWGRSQISNESANRMKVALLQVNLNPERVRERNYKNEITPIIEEMILQAAKENLGLLVMPESALPGFLSHETEYRALLKELSGRIETPILTGAVRHEYSRGKFRYYNSALLFRPDGRVEHYDKLHPVPFSERLPYDDVLPWLQKIELGQGAYSPGREFKVFDLDQASFSVLICFESIFPRLARTFVGEGAHFLVNITNDSWFRDTPGPYQHAQMAVMRSVENRVPIARCGNTGISMLIDPYGRVSQVTEMFTRRLIIGDLPLISNSTTLYRRWGEWFSALSLIISAILLGGWVRSRLKTRREKQNS